MSRTLRIEFPGALYYAAARGNNNEKLFLDDADRELFLQVLASVIEKYHLICHAYCLMDNHYHLLIETPDANISLGMRQINGIYTQDFNKKRGKKGHLFQGRFTAILVEKENYLLEMCRHILLNPVRLKEVNHPRAWKWSSYLATVGIKKDAGFLTVDHILAHFNQEDKKQAYHAFTEFVMAGTGQESLLKKVRGRILLGSDEFIEKIRPYVQGKESVKEIPRSERFLTRPGLGALFAGAGSKKERNQKLYEAHIGHGYTLKEIGEHLGIHYSTVSKAVKRLLMDKAAAPQVQPVPKEC